MYPTGGALTAIISSVGVAVLSAVSSYFAYQKKKLCFKIQGESGKNRGTRSDPQVLSNLLRSSKLHWICTLKDYMHTERVQPCRA
ncbi:CD99 antigen-like [Cyprinus carpio]|uniref:CD99 antigen-like n=1 Tax=Cyprinus carpio TaxID=7962 RepID=A0A9Q9Y4B6_CYPCA|nr:CD99 antigen-like [Cyprinus carpio]